MSGQGALIEAAFAGRLGEFRLDVVIRTPAAGVSVIFGPSGCGKTTLLRCIAGLERLPGRLSVAGEVWQDGTRFVPPHRRPVGFVFQDASLLPHLSVRRNLLFGYERARGRRPIGLDQVAPLLGLERLLERGVERLSGGERQRVSIGRALLSQPALLLMDEPLANLDAERKAEVLPYLERLHADLSIPILYVTHDRAEAARLGDRLIPMRDGRTGEAVSLRATPTDELARLSARLQEVGPEALQAELVAAGAADAVAILAITGLTALSKAGGAG